MMHFDIDELTVLEAFVSDSRQECLETMRAALPELEEDREMLDLVISVIGKVEDMTDRDYLDIDYYDAVDTTSELKTGDYYYDERYVFIDGEPDLHAPIDFIWMDPDYIYAPSDVTM